MARFRETPKATALLRRFVSEVLVPHLAER